MRIWGAADPMLLGNRHLSGEHLENHQIQNAIDRRERGQTRGGWLNHPEVLRIWETNRPMQLICLRHELLRVEMQLRFGDHHMGAYHPSPPLYSPFLLDRDLQNALVAYVPMAVAGPGEPGPAYFESWLRELVPDWPQTRLEHDAPWERDGQTIAEYILGESYGGGQRVRTIAP